MLNGRWMHSNDIHKEEDEVAKEEEEDSLMNNILYIQADIFTCSGSKIVSCSYYISFNKYERN